MRPFLIPYMVRGPVIPISNFICLGFFTIRPSAQFSPDLFSDQFSHDQFSYCFLTVFLLSTQSRNVLFSAK